MRVFIIIILLFPLISFCQITIKEIEEKSIPIQSPDTLNNSIYNQIKAMELIMVGEMHGTWEPSLLVKGFSDLILKNEDDVSIGIEIPNEEMVSFIEKPTDSTLIHSKFFTRNSSDGRNGEAWFQLIQYCYNNSNIHLFFYDNYLKMRLEKDTYNSENTKNKELVDLGTERDNAMYLSLIKQKNKYPNTKIITLSGNLHNWLLPRKGSWKMGTHCYNDTINFNQKKICSINHLFSEGTMLNSMGFKALEFNKSIYSEAVKDNKYMMFYYDKPDQYNAIFYTRKVTHSNKIND